MIILPVLAYPTSIARANSVRHPLKTLRDCVVGVGTATDGTHLYVPYDELGNHAYYYYLRPAGRWIEHGRLGLDELRTRLARGSRALVVLSRSDYLRLIGEVNARDGLVLTDRDWAVIVVADRFQLCIEAADRDGGATVRTSGGTTS